MATLGVDDDLWERAIASSELDILTGDDDANGAQSRDHVERIGAAAPITATAVDSLVDSFAQMRGCDARSIVYYCEPVVGDDGAVRVDEVQLIFARRMLVGGSIIEQRLHTMSVLTSQEVQQLARAAMIHAKF